MTMINKKTLIGELRDHAHDDDMWDNSWAGWRFWMWPKVQGLYMPVGLSLGRPRSEGLLVKVLKVELIRKWNM